MDHKHQVIVAARATGQVSDKGQAVAMTRETILNTGETPRELSADAGYYSAKAVAELGALGLFLPAYCVPGLMPFPVTGQH